jgi:chemotaxis protein MotB
MAGKGGAWKVAFADFMTAMMAFFLVMWLSAQDKEILIATSRYFQNPFSSPYESKSGLLDFDATRPANRDSGASSSSDRAGNTSAAQTIDLQFLNSVAKDVYRLLNLDEALADRPIDVQVTSDGLRITLYDRAQRPLFESSSAKFTTWGEFVMQSMAWMVERHGFRVVVEGHTRQGLDFSSSDYGAWELSSDRANAARRALVHYAVEESLIERVSGYADTRPVDGNAPESDANQRVTLSLRLGRLLNSASSTLPPSVSATPTPKPASMKSELIP